MIENQQQERLSFVLAKINPDDERMFAPVACGTVFRLKEVDEERIEMNWMAFRQVQHPQTGAIQIQIPPPVFKWVLDKRQYIGAQTFQQDEFMGPGHTYRLMWIIPPEDDPTIKPGETSRIIKPAPGRIILPHKMGRA